MTLRVAVFTGTLACGGAEKQLVYQLAALRNSGVSVEVLSLTRGELHERAIQALDIPVRWVGRMHHPAARLVALTRAVSRFRPHVVQASHFFMNLYVVAAARAAGAVEIGSVRSDGYLDLRCHGRWGKPLLRWPRTLIANSRAAERNLASLGVDAGTVEVLPNVIDLVAFDAAAGVAPSSPPAPTVIAVGRLDAVKRYERFLDALAAVRRRVPAVRGAILGDGPERRALEAHARTLGLLPGTVEFLGAKADVPARLRASTVLVSCSDHEGFPNVLLEGMAAGLPIVTTPAGDCPLLVRDNANGYVVPFDDPSALAERITSLATDRELATRLGDAGRRLVEREYSAEALGSRLLMIYSRAAATQRKHTVAPAVL